MPSTTNLRLSDADMLAHIAGSTPGGTPLVSEEEAGERTEGLGVELAEDLYGLRRVLNVSILCVSKLST